MERLRSVAIVAGGLLAALALFALGRPSSDDLRGAAADLDGLVRETAAGVQARADTLAQLPRLGWAVATDETTVRDLTTEELAFRTHPGEHIEITQLPRGGGPPKRLLHLPDDSDLQLPVLTGTHVVVRANQAHVVTVVSVEPRQRADELVGILAVAKQLDTSAIQQRLTSRGIDAELRTSQASITLAGHAPKESAVDARIPLAGPAGAGAAIVAANAGRARWPRFASPFVLVLSLAGAGLVWRRVPVAARASASPRPARITPATSVAPVTPATSAVAARSTAPRPVNSVPIDTGGPANRSPITPAVGQPIGWPIDPAAPAAPIAEAPRERALTGRVDISLARSGSVSVPPRGTPPRGAAAGAPGSATDPHNADPRTDEYRSLFAEFVNLRRTTGEPVEGLDVDQFIRTLREKRAQIMKQLPVKDVRFKLAFQNGKAAIRYMTVN